LQLSPPRIRHFERQSIDCVDPAIEPGDYSVGLSDGLMDTIAYFVVNLARARAHKTVSRGSWNHS
jgi:hypothetical protein